MRKIPAVAAVALLLLLSGCTASPDDAYVDAVVEETPQILDRGSKSELAELGQNTCEALENGTPASDVSAQYVNLGFSDEEADAVVRHAEAVLCP